MKYITLVIALTMAVNCTACSSSEVSDVSNGGDTGNGEGQNGGGKKAIRIIIDGTPFTATLEDNQTASAFSKSLPLTVRMEDVNANEKYARLGQGLPTSEYSPGTIRSGDLMLWGSNGLVLFYKTFQGSYRYTRLGSLNDPSGLAAAAGSGTVTATFELITETDPL